MVWSAAKRQIQRLAGAAGYRIVPRGRDANSLRRWLFRQPIHTVIDVGASTGETSSEWLTRFPLATVHAIEPLPASFAALQRLQARNADRLRIYNYAIGRERGHVPFRLHTQHHTSSSLLARTEFSVQILPETREETVIDVALTTLDDLFAGSFDSMKRDILLKLDVQGVEADVLNGATRFIRQAKYFLTEVSLAPVYVGQSDFKSVHAALTDAGLEFKGFIEQCHTENLAPLYVDVLYANPAV